MKLSVAVDRQSGSAGDLHGLDFRGVETATLWLMNPTGVAVVMGSAQSRVDFEVEQAAAEGIEIAERFSGGGAVYIDPAATLWIDVVIPKAHRWAQLDLSALFVEVGRSWQIGLGRVGLETEIMLSSRREGDDAALSRAACWAGCGWGELTSDAGKVLGLSQRRSRSAIRVQAMASFGPSAARVVDYLKVGSDVADRLRAAIGTGPQAPVGLAAISDAVISELTAAMS